MLCSIIATENVCLIDAPLPRGTPSKLQHRRLLSSARPAGVQFCEQSTYDIWQEAIAYCKPGKHYKGIGGVIEDLCTAKGYTTVPNFCELLSVCFAL